MTINEMIEFYGIEYSSINIQTKEKGDFCRVTKNMNKLTEEVKNSKPVIITELKNRKLIQEEKNNKEEKERINSYSELKSKLPERNIISKNNDIKAKEILSKISNSYFKNDPEMDGVNLSISANNGRIQKEAQKYCVHELETTFFHGYTGDARKKLERVISCKKCGLYIHDEVSENILIDKILSC